jgi:hypothetical protein
MTLLRRLLTWLLVLAAVAATALAVAYEVTLRRLAHPLPARAPAPALWMAPDLRPVVIQVTAAWQKLREVTTVHAFVRDHTIWRRMHFDDWDVVADPLRASVVDTMFARYREVLIGPEVWARLTVFDWDEVPQPMRAMAFIRMVEYWNEHYGVGIAHAIARQHVADTMSAIVMAESWFEHRAVQESQGNRDLGLSQASDFCRTRLDALSTQGFVDVALTDEDYFDPWQATRVVAVWFDLMLAEANGDLDLAVRAYHRGIRAARGGEGDEYLAHVRRVRGRFIRNEPDERTSPTWHHIWTRVREEFGPSGAMLSREEPLAGLAVPDGDGDLPSRRIGPTGALPPMVVPGPRPRPGPTRLPPGPGRLSIMGDQTPSPCTGAGCG